MLPEFVPLFVPLLCLISGILAASHLDPRSVWLCLPLALLLGLARRRLWWIAVFLLGAGLRNAVPLPPEPEPPNDAVRLTGTIVRAPEWRGLGVNIDVDGLQVDGRPLAGRARLTEFLQDPDQLQLFNALDLGGGDRVEILVALRRPATYRDPGVFNFRHHLELQGIFWTGTIRNPRLVTVSAHGRHLADRLRKWTTERIGIYFDDANVRGLVLGMVLGRTAGLSAATERQFQAGGLFHLVVVSGFNIAVIAATGMWLGRGVARRRRTRLLVVFLCVAGYALLVGWQTPAVRAAIMAFVFIAGRVLDRGHSPLNATALAAFVLLLVDPASIEDRSFQMTFAAVAAVVGIGVPAAQWIFHRWNQRLSHFGDASRDELLDPEIADWRLSRRMWCERHGIPLAAVWPLVWPLRLGVIFGEALIVTIGVESVFAYFMVESFHRIAPVSPLLNVPAELIAAAITPLGLSLILLPHIAGAPVAWCIRQLVAILLWTIQAGLSLPYATLRVPSPPMGLWALYGAALAVGVLAIRGKRPRTLAASAVSGVALLAWMAMGDFSPRPPASVVVTVLDVGQGDSILLEFPDGRRMLIDGGGVAAGRFLGLRDESTFSIGEDVVSAYLFSRGIRRLDTVVLTHAHNDHMDGLFDVMANFRIGSVWIGKNPPIPAYQAFLDQLAQRKIPVRQVAAGERYGDISVLHPPAGYSVRKTAQNNDSVVLLLDTGTQTALFTGDLEIAIPAPEFVNLLKVPHHGSGGVKLKVRSEVRVISVGANNPFGHPSPSALPAWRTDRQGAIQVTLSGRHPVAEPAR